MDIEGRQLGAYRVHELLGEGGMAQVFRAEHTRLGRPVALKVLHRDLSGQRDHLARFRRETRILARLHHPGIVEILDADFVEGMYFFAMALIEAPTLEQLLERRPGGRLLVAEAGAVMDSVLDALEVVHAEGVIHRDLKPSNVFVPPDGQAVISDFGIARSQDEMTQLTRSGSSVGTLLYMAPEQLDGSPVDAAADLYAAGLMLYRAVCGQLPFTLELSAIVKAKVVDREIAAPRTVYSEVPPALEAVIQRACRRDRTARFASAGEFREALGVALAASGITRPVRRAAPFRGSGHKAGGAR